MDALFGHKSKHEVEQLMKKVGRERKRVLEQFKALAMALEPGQERYQSFLSALPKIDELRAIIGEMDAEREYEIVHNLNGYTIRRLR